MAGNIPGIILLLGATVLLVLASISVPVTDEFYFLKATFNGISVAGTNVGRSVLKLGMWGVCLQSGDDKRCSKTELGYNLDLDFLNINDTSELAQSFLDGVSKALILIPIAAAISFVAFLFALSTFFLLDVLASIISLFAAFITAIAFIVASALFVTAYKRIDDNISGTSVSLHNAYWFLVAALIAQIFASVFVLFGCVKRRRHERATRGVGAGPEMRQKWWARRTPANGAVV